MRANTVEKIWRLIKERSTRNGECIELVHACDTNGYPRVSWGNVRIKVAKFVYEQKHGPIPTGLVLRHRCDNRKCVRLGHLHTGTQLQNVRDSWHPRRIKPGRYERHQNNMRLAREAQRANQKA